MQQIELIKKVKSQYDSWLNTNSTDYIYDYFDNDIAILYHDFSFNPSYFMDFKHYVQDVYSSYLVNNIDEEFLLKKLESIFFIYSNGESCITKDDFISEMQKALFKKKEYDTFWAFRIYAEDIYEVNKDKRLSLIMKPEFSKSVAKVKFSFTCYSIQNALMNLYENNELKVGSRIIIDEMVMTSLSLDKLVKSIFINQNILILKISVSEGARGLYLGNITKGVTTCDYVFDSNQKFMVTAIGRLKEMTLIEADLIL